MHFPYLKKFFYALKQELFNPWLSIIKSFFGIVLQTKQELEQSAVIPSELVHASVILSGKLELISSRSWWMCLCKPETLLQRVCQWRIDCFVNIGLIYKKFNAVLRRHNMFQSHRTVKPMHKYPFLLSSKQYHAITIIGTVKSGAFRLVRLRWLTD